MAFLCTGARPRAVGDPESLGSRLVWKNFHRVDTLGKSQSVRERMTIGKENLPSLADSR